MAKSNRRIYLGIWELVKNKLSKEEQKYNKFEIALYLIEKYKMCITRGLSNIWIVDATVSEKNVGAFEVKLTDKDLWRAVMLAFLELDDCSSKLENAKKVKAQLVSHKGLAYVEGYKEKFIIQCQSFEVDSEGNDAYFLGVTSDRLDEYSIQLKEIKSVICLLDE